LYAGDSLWSNNRLHELVMQVDGNLVGYDHRSTGGERDNPFWSSETAGGDGSEYVVLQPDGNLVLYSDPGATVPLWATDSGPDGYRFVLQDDRNLVLYSVAHGVVWTSDTAI
jgi:hypothetical protein